MSVNQGFWLAEMLGHMTFEWDLTKMYTTVSCAPRHMTWKHHQLIEETKSFSKLFPEWKSDHYKGSYRLSKISNFSTSNINWSGMEMLKISVNLETTWCLHGNHVMSTWKPHVFYVETMWFPCENHILSRWTPHGFHIDTLWFPCGHNMVIAWTPHGF